MPEVNEIGVSETKSSRPAPQLEVLRSNITEQGMALTLMLSKASEIEKALYGNVVTGEIDKLFSPRQGNDKPETFPGHMPLIWSQMDENADALNALSQFLDSIIDGLTGEYR